MFILFIKSSTQKFNWKTYTTFLNPFVSAAIKSAAHCGIRMWETIHTGAGHGAESREHFCG